MLINQWLQRLPAHDGILVCRETTTKSDTAEEVDAEARALWVNASFGSSVRPDNFQVVNKDGKSISAAHYSIVRASVFDLSEPERPTP